MMGKVVQPYFLSQTLFFFGMEVTCLASVLRYCFEEHLSEKEKETCHFADLNPRLGADYPVPTEVNQSVSSHKKQQSTPDSNCV